MAESAEFQVVANVVGQDKIEDLVAAMARLEEATAASTEEQRTAADATEFWYRTIGEGAAELDDLIQKTTGLNIAEFMENAVAAAPEMLDSLNAIGVSFDQLIATIGETDFTTDNWRESLGALAEPLDQLLQKVAGINLEQFAENMKKASEETGGWREKLDGILGPLDDVVHRITGLSLANVTSIGIIAGVILKLTSWTREIIALGDELVDLAKRRDVSLEFLQEMKFVADQTGISFHLLTMATQELNRRVASGTPQSVDAIKKLGFSVKEVMEMNSEERFRAMSEALGKIANSAERAALSNALFGRTGRELANMGPEVARLTKLYQDLGLAIDPQLLKAGDALSDNWKILKDLFAKLRSEELGPIVILLAQLSERLIGTAVEVKKNEAAAKEWKAQIDGIMSAIGDGLPLFKNWGEELRKIASYFNAFLAIYDTFGLGAVKVEEAVAALPPVVDAAAAAQEDLNKSQQTSTTATDAAAASHEKLKDAVVMSTEEALAMTKVVQSEMAPGLRIAKENNDALTESLKRAKAVYGDITEEMRRMVLERRKLIEIASVTPEASLVLNTAAGRFTNLTARPPGMYGQVGEKTPTNFFKEQADAAAELERRLQNLNKIQQQFNTELAAANDLAQLFGDSIGSTLGQILSMVASAKGLKDLFSSGGIGAMFSKSSEAAGGGIWGAISGALSVGGLIGQIAGPIIAGLKALFSIGGRGPGTVMAEAGRDLGIKLTDEMAQSIFDNGGNVQLALGALFEAGLYKDKLDKAAEEVGDILSGFEQGLYSAEDASNALADSVPYLIEHFDELGPEGEAQIQRIIEASQRLGIEFEGLDKLISLTFDDEQILEVVRALGVTQAAADKLGITFGELQTRVESIFAPETLETMAENFGKTADEMRKILEDLGVNFQTDLERMAAGLGLTVEDFQALGAAFEAATGIPADQLTTFLEQSGLSVSELATSLGVDITASLGSVGEEVSNTNDKLIASVDLAGALADELGRAAQNAASINVSIPSVPTTGAQNEYEGRVTGPRFFYIEPGVTEDVFIKKPGKSGNAMGAQVNYTFSPTIHLVPGTTEQQAEQIVNIAEGNISGMRDRLRTALGIE